MTQIATHTIVIYDEVEKVVIAEVYAGEGYDTNKSIYNGTLEEFYQEFPFFIFNI